MLFNGSFFIQIFGFAMGTSFAPIGANIYLALLEKDLKDLIVSDPSLSWPKFFKRYIDDGLKIALYSLAETKKFIELYNSLVPSSNLTLESHGSSVKFLDLKIFSLID